jgi:hypothetical protein
LPQPNSFPRKYPRHQGSPSARLRSAAIPSRADRAKPP